MIEGTLKKSLEIKEEKVKALESRLEESVSRNQVLREEMQAVRCKYEALQQRQEEEKKSENTR